MVPFKGTIKFFSIQQGSFVMRFDLIRNLRLRAVAFFHHFILDTFRQFYYTRFVLVGLQERFSVFLLRVNLTLHKFF